MAGQVQKSCKWRGEMASEAVMYVALSLLGAGYLREEFRHSPYVPWRTIGEFISLLSIPLDARIF